MMCANVSDILNNIYHPKHIRNRNGKPIIIISKNKPDGKVKRIWLIGSPHKTTLDVQVRNNEFKLQNILEAYLKPREIVTLPLFQPIDNHNLSKKNKIKIDINNNRKALSQSSLKNCGNACQYQKYKYDIYHNSAHFKANYKVYRCQISTNQEACCCSCNSDAMFEVMKSLYDCYKRKNCDNCNCFLCGRGKHEVRGPPEKEKIEIKPVDKVESRITAKKKALPGKIELEEAKQIPETKSQIEVGKLLAQKEAAVITEKLRETPPDLLRILETTPQDQKEKIIKEAVLKGTPIPEAKTGIEKKIIDKIIKDVGLPPKPKSPSKKAKYESALHKGLITPLEGKTASQKEKILRGQANSGLKLPEGRTPSEKALIAKVQSEAIARKKITQLEKKTAKSIKESKGPSDECICNLMTPIVDTSAGKITSAHGIKKDKELGALSSLKGKTKSQKEKILKGMALQGTTLPEGKTASENELLDTVRKSLGLPPAPKTPDLRQKYKAATAAGVIAPLEGKTAKQKEKILREEAALGIPLPEGRTASEKSIVAKIKALAPPVSDIPVSSKVLRKVKDTGLLTPIKGKPREEIEKILTGLAMHGVPLPEVRTASEKKIVDKIHADLGLPPPPVSSAGKEKYQKAYANGLIIPLEGKTASQKEKILKNQAGMGLELPVGRTSSEKALIEQVKAKAKEFAPIKQLEGKPPKEKEKILKGLAMNGILLPEAKSPSEKKIIEKVREDLGLPPEPTSESEKRVYKQSIATGDIAPLEGKSPIQKEKILRNVAKMGFKLPTGRTPSEKALVGKILAAESIMPLHKASSIEMEKKAKSGVLLARLEGKPPEHKEKILKELAIRGVPLPEARTASEKKLIDKVQKDVSFLLPKGLPEGQLVTSKISEIRLPSQVVKKAKDAGLLTPLKGKKKEQKENILKGLAMNGIPLPEPKTLSEQKVIEKVQQQIGLPPIPETPSEKKKYTKAIISGQIAPLEGKTAAQKENIIKNQLRMGLNVPVGRTPSEKVIIDKAIQSEIRVPSQVLKKAKDAGLLTPLTGKKKKEKEAILKGLAMNGIPLPEAKTSSENKIIEKVREDLGLPVEPATPNEKAKYKKAIISGQLAPLEGKNFTEKEEILKNQLKMGLKPQGRTSSEKSLINKLKKEAPVKKIDTISPEKLKKAIDTSMVVPLEGKTKKEKEKILKDLALRNIALPEAKTASDKKIIQKVQTDVGLPPLPKTSYEKEQYTNALAKGLIAPLEGKTAEQKEKLLQNQAAMGLTLPKGRTTSEKALIARIKNNAPKAPKSREQLEKLEKKSAKLIKEAKGPSDQCICGIISPDAIAGMPIKEVKGQPEEGLPSQVFKKAKEAGLLTPLEGKKKEQKEKILKGLAMNNIPLPVAKSPSENKIIEKVREDLGLPPVPQSPSGKEKYNKAIMSGLVAPLEGKTLSQKEDILKNQLKMGFDLPNGRTTSEKALISKIKKSSPLVSKSKSLMVPLEGKTKEEKEKILKDLALRGIPLPKAKTTSDKKIIHKVQTDVGLPPPPKTSYEKEQYEKALAQGYITPLEGKTAEQKEKLLRAQAAMGLTLPTGRTSSEKTLISKIKKTAPATPKSREQLEKLKIKSAKKMKEAKGPSDECICNIISSEILTETPSPKVPSEVMKKAKEAGLLTPLKGKSKEQKESILKGLALKNIPLPEAKSPSEKKIIEKVREDLGLPPVPKSLTDKEKYNKAIITGQIAPLEGKTHSQKQEIIQNQVKMGLNLPKGRTSSEKSLIAKIKKQPELSGKILEPKSHTLSKKSILDTKKSEVRVPSEIMKKAKAAGLLTPLKGKKKKQKETILKGLAMNGIPLPEAKTPSEKKIIEKIRADVGLPPEPESPAEKAKYKKAVITGKIGPLEGKTRSQKEDIIRNQLKMGLALPKGRTSSEKSLIDKVKVESEVRLPSKQFKKAKAAGLLTPLEGKSKEQKESILKGLAMNNIPLPEAKSPSENKILEKVRTDLGLPPPPELPADKEKYNKAIISGNIAPLEGKTVSQKENIIRNQLKLGLTVPKGRTASESSLIERVEKSAPKISKTAISQIKSLEGKTKEEKEKIVKNLALRHKPLPEAKSASDKKIIEKVQNDIGLPPQPKTSLEKIQYEKAAAKGYIVPLEGKSTEQKEKILRKQAAMGITLPKGRTSSEKALIAKIKTSIPKTPKQREKIEKLEKASLKAMKESKGPADKCICDVVSPVIEKSVDAMLKSQSVMSEQIKEALAGKPKHEKEKILRDLAMKGIALPKAKNKSEKKIIDKVRVELGLPSEPTNEIEKQRYDKALTKGLVVPLEGKSKSQKGKILRDQAALGLNLPKGRTPSEVSMIKKVKKTTKKASKISVISGSFKELAVKPKKDVAAKHGISESFQDITKTTTCDKGCGCDSKKVKFKHSYVKIRITSPDMSSVCPCPEECYPGIQGGVFTDNEGIKITVGRVAEVNRFHYNNHHSSKNYSMITLNGFYKTFYEDNVEHKITKSESYLTRNGKNKFRLRLPSPKIILDSKPNIGESDDAISTLSNNYDSIISSSLNSQIFEIDSSLSFVTPNSSDSHKSLNVLHQYNRHVFENEDDVVHEDIHKFEGKINLEYRSCDCFNSLSDLNKESSPSYFKSENIVENLSQYLNTLKYTRSDFQEQRLYDSTFYNEKFEQNEKQSKMMEDVLKEMIAKDLISQSSSFIIIVSTSSEETSDYYYPTSRRCSSLCIQISKNCCYRDTPRNSKRDAPIKKIEFKFSNDDVSLHPCSTSSTKKLIKSNSALQTCNEMKKSRVISTDTTQDRPCCCDHVPEPRSHGVDLGARECPAKTSQAKHHCSSRSPYVDKTRSSDKSCTNSTSLMDMLKKTMSTACGTRDDITKVVKGKSKSKEKQRNTNLPCGCCSSSIELSHYEISVEVEDSKKKCKSASRKSSSSKNNAICQCPDESTPIDCVKYLKQVQSELTMCTSGFKLQVAPQASLEEVLGYYAKQAQSQSDCSCSKRAKVCCECPEKPEPFKGLKLHMDGKGSASKGLNGFLCFDLLDCTSPYQSFRIDSNSMLVSCSSDEER